MKVKVLPLTLGLGWVAAVVAGITVLAKYEYAPGADGIAPKTWPGSARIPRAATLPTLVVFAHPKCPCTRATIGELAELTARCEGRVKAHVIFYRPIGEAESWAHTDLWRAAWAIPGVEVMSDEDAVEARRFGATTSGQVALYDAEGRRLFSGGITASRGHAGDNTGRSAVIELLYHRTVPQATTPAFGCSLRAPTAPCGAEEDTCQP